MLNAPAIRHDRKHDVMDRNKHWGASTGESTTAEMI